MRTAGAWRSALTSLGKSRTVFVGAALAGAGQVPPKAVPKGHGIVRPLAEQPPPSSVRHLLPSLPCLPAASGALREAARTLPRSRRQGPVAVAQLVPQRVRQLQVDLLVRGAAVRPRAELGEGSDLARQLLRGGPGSA